MVNNIKNAGLIAFGAFVLWLFSMAWTKYPGNGLVYVLFTLTLNTLLYQGFRKNHIFFDTFIGVLFWLGYWLKFTFRMAFLEGRFHEPVGLNFDYTGAAYDRALLVTSCGVAALLLVSWLRGRFIFNYPDRKIGTGLEGLFVFYKKHRYSVWLCFFGIFIAIALSNAWLGIYQRGVPPRTVLPYKLGGIYTWLLMFGNASVTALILEFELLIHKRVTYIGVMLCMLESFLSSVSMMSRAMVINVATLAFGTLKSIRMKAAKLPSISFSVVISAAFVIFFGLSLYLVLQMRLFYFNTAYGDRLEKIEISQKFLSSTGRSTKLLLLDRWVGIEGSMAVSSHPDLGKELWKKAWKEKYTNFGTSFYDLHIASSGYSQSDKRVHHISLPGILAFLFYPGSFPFLFGAMFFAAALAFGIEYFTYRLSGENVILTAMMAQVVAFRYAHFGYVPGQSYLLFGTLVVNVVMIYLLNRFLSYRYQRQQFPNSLMPPVK